jgi:hypothetical protein
MALADFGFSAKIKSETETTRSSLETETSRGGYIVRRSAAVAQVSRKLAGAAFASGLGLAAFGAFGAGNVLTLAAVSAGLALMALGAKKMLRRPRELEIDRRGRAFHLLSRSLSGHPTRHKTIRFEEVCEIELVDRLSPLDAPAAGLSWDMGRIELTWREGRKQALICGDVSELEPLLSRMRGELNRA